MPSVIELAMRRQACPSLSRNRSTAPKRIGGGDLQVRAFFLQRDGTAGERAASADRAGEAVEPSVGLVPDLRPRGFNMRLAVRDIVELVGPDRAVLPRCAPACSAMRPETFT